MQLTEVKETKSEREKAPVLDAKTERDQEKQRETCIRERARIITKQLNIYYGFDSNLPIVPASRSKSKAYRFPAGLESMKKNVLLSSDHASPLDTVSPGRCFLTVLSTSSEYNVPAPSVKPLPGAGLTVPLDKHEFLKSYLQTVFRRVLCA